MIELKNKELIFTFPDVHESARLHIDFQRTLRIPDDGQNYPLPAGLGRFPLKHVDDFASSVPDEWMEHGGLMLPMYQSEAMWINFSSGYDYERGVEYPFAVKIATGKVNAVTGKQWTNNLNDDPQDYLVVPEQPWLDGYCVEKGVIRQFVAMPLGSGYSAEEQATGKAEHGGLQIMACPMKREVYERRFPKREREAGPLDVQYFIAPPAPGVLKEAGMGLSPGGRIKQEICDDPYGLKDWRTDAGSRCFVHIANSLTWRAITGSEPTTTPLTSKEYVNAGVPWFDWYDDGNQALKGSEALQGMKSVAQLGKDKGDVPLPDNQSVPHGKVTKLYKPLKPGQVREWKN